MVSVDKYNVVPFSLPIFTQSPEMPTISNERVMEEENTIEELQVMLDREALKYCKIFDYLSVTKECDLGNSNEMVSESWRKMIVDWCYEIVDHFGFDREVVSIALNFLDRVAAFQTISSKQPLHRREFQLIAVTSLYLAIKVHGESDTQDGRLLKLKIQTFVELSRGLFTVEVLESKEMEILKMLEWNVNPTSTVQFVAQLMRLFPTWTIYDCDLSRARNAKGKMYETARYLTELTVCVSTFSFQYKPSEIAYAAILCSMISLENSNVQVPYEVQVDFIRKVAAATELTPESVAPVRALLMELRPSMFQPEETCTCNSPSRSGTPKNSSDITAMDGKVSPICVMCQCRNKAS
eukprot:CAMPEP_0178938378 /NCGR_PEP_ID=MMETSP0786-20121207/26295_1 /TAXON_ID=186022 /ORGANISM="Thalassionema frauenfeldii, Strain CCMP 1798" /LENGTH=351 /DNA_ID=CAMNT_0020617085 /DNA_START=71 /DNA_END=1126 /DNA_ORIENTATION=-